MAFTGSIVLAAPAQDLASAQGTVASITMPNPRSTDASLALSGGVVARFRLGAESVPGSGAPE